jgi:serine/threonine-protein phosphatase PGAM5
VTKYDETYPQDEKRILTQLGRLQAEATGRRIGEYIRGVNAEFGPCHVKVMRVSNLARAKETAQIIHDNMGDVGEVEMADPDELLNEGR